MLGSFVESLTKATLNATAVYLLPELMHKQLGKQMFPWFVVQRRLCRVPGQGMMQGSKPCASAWARVDWEGDQWELGSEVRQLASE